MHRGVTITPKGAASLKCHLLAAALTNITAQTGQTHLIYHATTISS